MKFIDALQTGKPFKRPQFGHWIKVSRYGFFRLVTERKIFNGEANLQKDDYLADDWIIHERNCLVSNCKVCVKD